MQKIYSLNFLFNILNKYLQKIIIFNDFLKIELHNLKDLNLVLNILKNHTKFKYNLITDLVCVDFINFKKKRFALNYNLLSYYFNSRIVVTCFLNENDIIQSITNLFSGSNWMEREVWDLFGVFFFNHSDLRRILTDYGFSGYPFRKDFPLNGFFEVRYDENKQYLVYEPLELTQTFRFYDFLNPFNKKYIF